MADKLPPRFAPEGARFKRPDWAPEGSPADRQKRTYVDRIGDLEREIEDLKGEVKLRDAEIGNLQRQIDNRIEELDHSKKRAAGLDAKLNAVNEDRKGDVGRIEALQENLGHINDERVRLLANLDSLKGEHAHLRGQFGTQTTVLADARKSVAGAQAKLIAIAVLGVAGTVWGSLGNPLPFTGSDNDEAVKMATEKRVRCVLAARAKAWNLGPEGMAIAEPYQWLPTRPANILETKDLKFSNNITQVRLLGLKLDVAGKYGMNATISGSLTNSSSAQVRGLSGTVYVMSLFDDGSCKPIYSASFTKDVSVSPQTSADISHEESLPSSTKFDEGDVFLTDLSLYFDE